MKKEDLLYEKEKEANLHVIKLFIGICFVLIITMIIDKIGIVTSTNGILFQSSMLICILCLIPIIDLMVLKHNKKYTKYFLIIMSGILVGACYTVYSYYVIFTLAAPLIISTIYNDNKISRLALIVNIVAMLFGHIYAPAYTIFSYDPLNTLQKSLLLGFVPRLLAICCFYLIVFFGINRNAETVDSAWKYSESSKKSSEGIKRVFIESQEMLNAEDYDDFLKKTSAAVFRLIKFVRNNREEVRSFIVLRQSDGKFIAMNEKYNRVDDIISIDDKFMYFNDNDDKVKVVLSNNQNEGTCVINHKNILMTFYEKEELIGFIKIDTDLSEEYIEVKAIIDMLYNAIKLCISTKKAENILTTSQEELIFSLSEISESKSRETGQHIRRVSEYMKVLGKAICKTQRECNNLACAAMLHDVGKLIVPSSILEKPGKLTSDEFEVIKKHTSYGGELLKNVPGEMMKMAYNIAMFHHERWDGKGYNKIKGKNIDFYARYVSVIDVFDALISKRCYKEAWTLEDAYKEIVDNSGTQFDPKAVEVFKENFDDLVKIYNMYPDAKM